MLNWNNLLVVPIFFLIFANENNKQLEIMGIKLENEKVWQKFCYFFREVKGHSDWTDEQIDYSRNDDDVEEFILWLVEQIEN